ncbi:hypothetical protein CMV_011788 [Castanea mollissima]|uniref:Aminotransferase class I/classII large domain-containing protein n=1 Tax=Castanea mollissima TaxID=60419 RepID=A0A8J4VZR2_9ROSI|nr:hypothetical protein CMV_011788 [Castanea mollissima]
MEGFEDNPFHPTDNPHGVIQMGLAENQLSFDLRHSYLSGLSGLTKFRNAVANFMEKVRGNRVRFDPDRIVMSGGATGAHEMTCLSP